MLRVRVYYHIFHVIKIEFIYDFDTTGIIITTEHLLLNEIIER